MVTKDNLDDLALGPNGDLYKARIENPLRPGSGQTMLIKSAMYNPKTGTMAVGLFDHANIHHKYVLDQNYDDFVKMHLSHRTDIIAVNIFLDRHQARDTAEAWDMGFKAARAIRSAGFPDNTKLYFRYWEQGRVGPELVLGEV